MSTRTEEPSARAREIAAVSARLFRRAGYRETSIRDIARALDIKSASLYYHYGKKDDILFAIAHGLMQDFVREVTPLLAVETDPAEAIRAVVEAHLRFDFARLDEVVVSARERRSLPAEMQRPINALRARHRHALKGRIEEGVARKDFDVGDASLAASAVLDLLTGVKEWYHPPRDGRLDGIVTTYQRYVLALLGHRS
jgi:AcrR family transcriptional regulator